MKRLIRLFVSVLVPAFILAGVVASPAIAQDKAKDAMAAKAEKGKSTLKVLFENDKVRVTEVTSRPGDVGANVARPFRVIRPLKDGTIERTWADGKVDKVEWKTGEVKAVGPDKPFTPKNVGKTEFVLYIVEVKEPKK